MNNFGCYISETFEFPDNGLTLISAPSGKGKSTIIKAILFVLFNIGKKLYTFGEKTLKVKLEINVNGIIIKITRGKCPNRLILQRNKEIYEDIVAQNVINDLFGSNFPNVSFMDNRNIYKSFLMMTPMDKLKFLENFAFENINLEEIKEKVQSQIREKSKEITDIKNNMIIEQKILGRIPTPEDMVFPIKYKNREKAIKNERIRLKNTLLLYKRNMERISISEKELKIIKEQDMNNRIHQEAIKSAMERVEKLNTELSQINLQDPTKMRDENDLYELFQEQKEQEKMIQNLKGKIEETEKTEQAELQQKIIALKKNSSNSLGKTPIKDTENKLSGLYYIRPKFIEYEKQVKLLKEYQDITEDEISSLSLGISAFNVKLDALNKQYNDILISEKILECPSCKTNLTLHENKLKIYEGVVPVDSLTESPTESPTECSMEKQKIETLISRIKKELEFNTKSLNENITSLSKKQDIQKNIEELVKGIEEKGYNVKSLSVNKINEDIDNTNNLLKKIEQETLVIQELENRFNKKEFSITLKNMKIEYEKLIHKFSAGTWATGDTENKDIISKEKYQENSNAILLYQLHEDRYNALKKQIDLEKEFIGKTMKSIAPINVDIPQLEIELENLVKENSQLKDKRSLLKNNIALIDKFLENEKLENEIAEINEKIRVLEEQEITVSNEHAAALKMKQKILECESLSIYNVIDSINSTAGYYLEKFFVDENMIAKLLPFKVEKKGGKEKPQINLSIIYKEEECDINNLSGGELSRLILAFTLALAEIYNSKMILLDESTANLDHENTQNVFEVIKENFKDTLVIAIAHQVVEGSYDHVMYL